MQDKDQLQALIGKRVNVTTSLDTYPGYTGTLVEVWSIGEDDPIERQFIAIRLQDTPHKITAHTRIDAVTDIKAV